MSLKNRFKLRNWSYIYILGMILAGVMFFVVFANEEASAEYSEGEFIAVASGVTAHERALVVRAFDDSTTGFINGPIIDYVFEYSSDDSYILYVSDEHVSDALVALGFNMIAGNSNISISFNEGAYTHLISRIRSVRNNHSANPSREYQDNLNNLTRALGFFMETELRNNIKGVLRVVVMVSEESEFDINFACIVTFDGTQDEDVKAKIEVLLMDTFGGKVSELLFVDEGMVELIVHGSID